MTTTRETVLVELTPDLTLRDLDRCQMFVSCEGGCGRCVLVSVTRLIAKHGIDAKVAELKFCCRTCEWRAPVKLIIERQTGPYRPAGNEPFYF